MTRKIKKNKKEEAQEEAQEQEEGPSPMETLFAAMDKPEVRMMALFGEIDEERTAELVLGMILMSQKQDEEEKLPIEFYLSTYS